MFYLLCMNVLHACICTTFIPVVWRSEGGVGSLGTVVTDGCELPLGTGIKPRSLPWKGSQCSFSMSPCLAKFNLQNSAKISNMWPFCVHLGKREAGFVFIHFQRVE